MYQTLRRLLKAIGLYQITGGVIGAGFIIYSVIFHPQLNFFWALYFLIGLMLYCFSIYTGMKTFQLYPSGIEFTLYVQLLQVVSFSLYGFNYLFNPGLGVMIGVDLTSSIELIFNTQLPKLGIGKAENEAWQLFINLIPLALLILIGSIQGKIKHTANLSFPK